jgi:DNA-binding SARP family transcriptional activator
VRGDVAYEATTLLNMAVIHKVQGDAQKALETSDAALALIASDRHSVAMAAIRSVRAWALAHDGDLDAARIAYQEAVADVEESGRGEPLLEACEIETWYGNEDRALALLEDAEPYVTRLDALEQMYLTYAAQLAIRCRDIPKAAELVEQFRIGQVGLVVAAMAQQLSIKCHLALLRGDSTAKSLAARAIELARGQGANLWAELDRLWLDTEPGSDALNRTIERLALVDPAYLSIAAERLVDCLDRLQPAALALVEKEIAARPERWRTRLRHEVDEGKGGAILASRLLEIIGETEDVARLRRFSRKARRHADPQLGKALARRLAPLVSVEDQGRVAVRIGTRHVEGTAIRRKVLTLMCYLLTRPRSSATRDEVLDTLWPEFEPTVALNSLNQTVYFLRRVFEPAYKEDTSPGYVRHESDVVWLDRQLVRSRSQRCFDFIKGLPPRPNPDQVAELVTTYQGLFALDFAYEDWAVAYRESLHSAFLQVVERAVAEDSATGHFERGIAVARRVLSIDPNAEQVELSLLRMLRVSGAHAAAAEQYAHYAHALRESLGIEPPPLDAL